MKRLQTIQDALASAVTKTPKHHHITSILKSLHWLKISQRIRCKIVSSTCTMLFKPLNPLKFDNYTYHPTARVYSLIIISVSISASNLIHSEVLQPLHSLRRTSSVGLYRNGLPKDIRQFAHPPNPPLHIIIFCYNIRV